MTKDSDRRRIGQARLLRRQGKTYNEIRAVVGPVSNYALEAWLKGIPRPAETFRSAPKVEMRRKCRQLRAQGLTYDEIREITGASVGSMSLWLRDMPIDRDHARAKAHRQAALNATYEQIRQRKATVRAERVAEAASLIGEFSDRELILVGTAIYWAEGSKNKPWRTDNRLLFINSDPSMILLFLCWLELFGVDRASCTFSSSDSRVGRCCVAEQYWAMLVGIDVADLGKTTLKRHNPTTVRYNTGTSYRGCLTIYVHRSARMYEVVEGAWQGIAHRARTTAMKNA